MIKDLKEGYGWDAFNMRGFWATETVMVMIASVFHNLILYLNRKVLRVGESIHQLKTMRSKYFAWPAILGSAGGTSVLRLGIKDRKLQRRIRDWLGKIAALPLKLPGEQCSTNCIAVGAYGSQEVQ